MKFSDINALAKAGYKPSDIKELLQLKEPEGNEGKDKEPEGNKGKDKEDAPIDYKKLYEEEKKLREELQNKNSKEPIKEPEKIEDIIKSVRKSIS